MSWPSGGRLSTSPRSIWAFCTACILVLMVPIRACWAELYTQRTKMGRFVNLLFGSAGTVGDDWWVRGVIQEGGGKSSREPIDCRCSYQRWHVSTVHLTHGDLLLGRRHGAHAERLGADGAGADHSWQRHWTVLGPAHPVKLLLEDSGPAGRDTAWRINEYIHVHSTVFYSLFPNSGY